MKKPDIKKLKYPLWFQIVFYCLTVVIPVCLIIVEGLTSKSSKFKITFGVIALIVLVWSAINKWLLSRIRHNIDERKIQLEHDYEIDVGNPDKIKYIWFSNEQKLAIFDTLNIGLWGLLFAVIAIGVSSAVMSIKGALICIFALYIIAFVSKFMIITILKGYDKGDETNEPKSKPNE